MLSGVFQRFAHTFRDGFGVERLAPGIGQIRRRSLTEPICLIAALMFKRRNAAVIIASIDLAAAAVHAQPVRARAAISPP